MRLSTCVALELVVGVSLVSGLGVSVTWGVNEARARWFGEARPAEVASLTVISPEPGSDEATRARLVVPEVDTHAKVETGMEAGVIPGTSAGGVDNETLAALEAMPRSEVGVAENPVHPGTEGTDYHGEFHGRPDQELLAPLRSGSIAQVRVNRGGSSISLRIDFDNGAQAAFKPLQAALQSVPRKEVAAYRINRLLGLSAVPPAIARAFAEQDIYDNLVETSSDTLARLRDEMRVKDGMVAGELSWWIPVIYKAKVGGYEIDTTDGIVTWKRLLTVGKDMPKEEVVLLGQISSMVLFDFIINNPDRWSGANARVSEDEKTLYFMDNTMSFAAEPEGHRKCRIYLKRSQKFSRSLVHALRTLQIEDVQAVMAHDKGPFGYLLSDEEIDMLMKRRDFAIAYIDELIAEYGEGAVLVFP